MKPDYWFNVDQHLWSTRRRLQLAETEEDFQSVALLCRETVLSLAQAVLGEMNSSASQAMSNQKAKQILADYFKRELPESSNKELRSYADSCLNLANALQHSPTTTCTQAELCTEACAHLVMIARILAFKETAPPNKRFRLPAFASAESEFIASWVFANFDAHPIAKSFGFTLKGFQYHGAEILIQVIHQNKEYLVSLHHPYWWKGANRVSADRLIDDILVKLLTQLDKEHFAKTGQPPA